MRLFTLLLILFQNSIISTVYADESVQVVKVTDPYLEMHTGPSVGYPITNIVKREETISILKSRTQWYLIKNNKNFEGWVHRSQLVKTLTLDNDKVAIKDVTQEDYLEHDWEMSMIGGDFGGIPMMTLSTSYAFTQNLSAELSLAQIVGDFSSRVLLGVNLLHHPYPSWKISPYFSIGTGLIKTSTRSTLAQLNDTTDALANVSLGAKMYLTRRFLLRADVKRNIIFQSKDKNEEITSWQVGFAFFF